MKVLSGILKDLKIPDKKEDTHEDIASKERPKEKEGHAKISLIRQSKPVLLQIIAYAKDPVGFLLFAGTNGAGKSYAAEAIYNAHTPYRLPERDDDAAMYVSQANLQMKFNDVFPDINYLFATLKNTKLLVIDDVGTRKPSEAFADFLYSVVDHRYTYRSTLGTIITTNRTSDEMRLFFGDAFHSRVVSGNVIRLEGKDRRRFFDF